MVQTPFPTCLVSSVVKPKPQLSEVMLECVWSVYADFGTSRSDDSTETKKKCSDFLLCFIFFNFFYFSWAYWHTHVLPTSCFTFLSQFSFVLLKLKIEIRAHKTFVLDFYTKPLVLFQRDSSFSKRTSGEKKKKLFRFCHRTDVRNRTCKFIKRSVKNTTAISFYRIYNICEYCKLAAEKVQGRNPY